MPDLLPIPVALLLLAVTVWLAAAAVRRRVPEALRGHGTDAAPAADGTRRMDGAPASGGAPWTQAAPVAGGGPGAGPLVEVCVPVRDEQHVLEQSIRELRRFLRESFPHRARITIAENGSSDGTAAIARRLAAEHDDVACVELPEPGRGRALRHVWTRSDADVVAYTDVDLSTDLRALQPLCRAILDDGYGVATASRLARGARTVRCVRRELISRLYNLLVRCMLPTRVRDVQCGFKAVSRQVARELLPLVEDEGWFFDTELLVLAERLGYGVAEVPARWVERTDSRVRILATAWADLRGLLRLRKRLQGRAPEPWRGRAASCAGAADDSVPATRAR